MLNEIEAAGTIIDCRGLACPQPVILTKKAIDKRPAELTIIVDNAAAKENVAKFAASNGYGVSIEADGTSYRLRLLASSADAFIATSPGPQDRPIESVRPVILFTRNTLGEGSEELGAILMKSMFASLLESTPIPQTLMLINSGVYLAMEDSPVLFAMKELQNKGVSIRVCGTCLDYFQIKNKLAVGSVTNMYSILSELKGPGRAITL